MHMLMPAHSASMLFMRGSVNAQCDLEEHIVMYQTETLRLKISSWWIIRQTESGIIALSGTMSQMYTLQEALHFTNTHTMCVMMEAVTAVIAAIVMSRETAFDPTEVFNLNSQPHKEVNTAAVMAMSGLGPQVLPIAVVKEVTVESPDAIDDVLAGLTGTSATLPGAAVPNAPVGVYLGPLGGPPEEGLADQLSQLSTEAQAKKERKAGVSNSVTV